MTFRFWRRKLFFIFLLIVLIIVLYLTVNQKPFNNDLIEINGKLLSKESQSLPPIGVLLSKSTTIDTNLIDIEDINDKTLKELSDLNKCDICLGIQFCPTFVNNLLVVNTPYILKDLSYRKAVIKTTNEKLTLLSQSSDKWSKLESIICTNASQSLSDCDYRSAVRNSFVSKSNLFSIENFRQFFRQMDEKYYAMNGKPNDYFLQGTFSQCVTKRYLDLLQNSFDLNDDKFMDLGEQSHLLSALLAFPGYAVRRMIEKAGSDLQVLNIKGVCGRIIAFDGNYQTLEEFTKVQNTFEVMAGLAVQIIQLVDDLQEEDPNWYYLQTELSFDSILVNDAGEVFLSDLNSMVIIDKSLFSEQTLRSGQSLLHSQVCNEPCFQTFHQTFLNALNTTSSLPSLECQRIHIYYGQRMYSMVCRNIFSSIESNNQKASRSGLLKAVPNKDRENVDDLLRECIYETSPGGRKQAIDELKDLLKSYLRFDENVDQNNAMNEDINVNEDDEDNGVDNGVNNDSNEDNNESKADNE